MLADAINRSKLGILINSLTDFVRGGGEIAYLMQDAEKMGNCSKEVMVAFFSETFSGFFMFVCLFVVLVFFFFFFFSGEIIFSTVKIKRTLRTNEGFSYEVFCCVTLQRSLSYLHHASAENFYIQDAKGLLNYFFIYFNTIRKKKTPKRVGKP